MGLLANWVHGLADRQKSVCLRREAIEGRAGEASRALRARNRWLLLGSCRKARGLGEGRDSQIASRTRGARGGRSARVERSIRSDLRRRFAQPGSGGMRREG